MSVSPKNNNIYASFNKSPRTSVISSSQTSSSSQTCPTKSSKKVHTKTQRVILNPQNQKFQNQNDVTASEGWVGVAPSASPRRTPPATRSKDFSAAGAEPTPQERFQRVRPTLGTPGQKGGSASPRQRRRGGRGCVPRVVHKTTTTAGLRMISSPTSSPTNSTTSTINGGTIHHVATGGHAAVVHNSNSIPGNAAMRQAQQVVFVANALKLQRQLQQLQGQLQLRQMQYAAATSSQPYYYHSAQSAQGNDNHNGTSSTLSQAATSFYPCSYHDAAWCGHEDVNARVKSGELVGSESFGSLVDDEVAVGAAEVPVPAAAVEEVGAPTCDEECEEWWMLPSIPQ